MRARQNENNSNNERPQPVYDVFYRLKMRIRSAEFRESSTTETVLRSFLPPLVVSATNIPAQFIITNVQKGIPHPVSAAFFNNKNFLSASIYLLLGSFVHNLPLSHRDTLNCWVNGKPILGDEQQCANTAFENFRLTATIAFANTTVTQYFATRGKQLTQGKTLPVFRSFTDMLSYTFKAFPTRFARMFVSIGSYVLTEPLKSEFDKKLPYEQYGYWGWFFQNMVRGAFAGTSLIAFENIWAHQLDNMHMKTFAVPSMRAGAREVWRTGGAKKLFCATNPSSLAMIAAYMTYDLLEMFLQGFGPNANNTSKGHSPTFFTQPDNACELRNQAKANPPPFKPKI